MSYPSRNLAREGGLALLLVIFFCGPPASSQALEFVSSSGDVPPLSGPYSTALSPDGRHVYVTSKEDSALTIFEREAASGRLTLVEALRVGLGGGDELRNVFSVLVSPDGRNVYALSQQEPKSGLDTAGDQILVFRRDEAMGTLELVEEVFDVAPAPEFGYLSAMASSPDGRHVYVSGSDSAPTLILFDRDATSGALELVEPYPYGSRFSSSTAVAVSSDGRNVYAAEGSSVDVFSRDATTGRLEPVGPPPPIIIGKEATALALSPDGSHLYATFVAGSDATSVRAFRRETSTGALTFLEERVIDAHDPSDTRRRRLDFVTVSPEGRDVLVASRSGSAVSVFHRNGDTGSLTLVDRKTDGTDGLEHLGGAKTAAVSPDGRHVYVAAYSDDALTVFERGDPDGELAFVETHLDDENGVFGGATDLDLSPDGQNVYVSSADNASLVALARDEATGALRQIGIYGIGEGQQGLTGATSVTVARSGSFVVATGSGDSVALFSRDPSEGLLERLASLRLQDSEGCCDVFSSVTVSPDDRHVYVTGYTGLDRGRISVLRLDGSGGLSLVDELADVLTTLGLSISPDGRHVYVARRGGIRVLARDRSRGTIRVVEDVPAFYSAADVTVSPDGRYVYGIGFAATVSSVTFGVAVWERDPSSGKLSLIQRVWDGNDSPTALDVASSVTVDPSGSRVYVTAKRDDAVNVFERDPDSGLLSFTEVHEDNRAGIHGIDGVEASVVSPDSRFVYTAASDGNAVAVFKRTGCIPSEYSLCLSEKRFQVEAEWLDFEDRRGRARVVPHGTANSGLFWFFGGDNWEMLVKVLDGCDVNRHFWVFAASTTNLEFTLRVTDTATDTVKSYFNRLGSSAGAIADTQAFGHCDLPILTIQAEPAAIPVGGASTVTVTARDQAGDPVGPRERIRLSADLGRLEEELVETDAVGRAQTLFTAGDTPGVATVTAVLDTSDPATASIVILAGPASMALDVDHTVVQAGIDASFEILAVVVNQDGIGLDGVPISLGVEHVVGTFVPGDVITTDSRGVATGSLMIQGSELQNVLSFTITATIEGVDGEIQREVVVLVV